MKKIAICLAVTLTTSVVYAHSEPDRRYAWLPAAKLQQPDQQLKKMYIGAGLSQRLLHGQAEWINPYGIAYAKLGAFTNDDHPFGMQVGFRYPYAFTGKDQNGYYFGIYAGYLDNVSLDNNTYQRLGAGIDLAYVMLDRERISTLSVGIGAAEKVRGSNGSVRTSPQLQFAYSLSFDVF